MKNLIQIEFASEGEKSQAQNLDRGTRRISGTEGGTGIDRSKEASFSHVTLKVPKRHPIVSTS
jgi:hypothetical protein